MCTDVFGPMLRFIYTGKDKSFVLFKQVRMLTLINLTVGAICIYVNPNLSVRVFE